MGRSWNHGTCHYPSRAKKKGHFMEVKINREIRDYTESMFFGLSMRQFFFSVIACVVAIGIYFLLRNKVGTETVSWMCVLGAAPFAALGFVNYHGMNAEQFVWAWIKSEILLSKRLLFQPENIYYEVLKSGKRRGRKVKERHDKNTK